jgi:membrane-associated phospholipid phosphatase
MIWKAIRLSSSAVFFLAVILSQHVSGQTPSPAPSPAPQTSSPSKTLEHEFFKNILRDQRAIWTSPFHWQRRDARWLAPLGFGTPALIATDRDTANWIAKFDRQIPASRVVSYTGSTYGAAGIAATFYFVGRARNDARARETGLLALEALIDSEIVVTSLKAITGRRRPLALSDRGDFFKGGRSFPSGHSSHAWALATVIAHEYHDRRLVQIGAYGAATAVSISRYTGKKHFLSDILVGSAIGYGIGRYVYRAHHRQSPSGGTEQSRDTSRWWPLISPTYNRRWQEYGLALAWTF